MFFQGLYTLISMPSLEVDGLRAVEFPLHLPDLQIQLDATCCWHDSTLVQWPMD